MIPVTGQAAGTFVRPLRKTLLFHCPAIGAGLRRAARVHCDKLTTSVFCFVRQLRDELSPRGVEDRLGETCPRQALDVQFLHRDQVEPIHQQAAVLVAEVLPLRRYLFMDAPNASHGLASVPTSLLRPREAALSGSKFPRALPAPARVVDSLPVRQGGECVQAHVNADARLHGPLLRRRLAVVNQDLRVPACRPANDPQQLLSTSKRLVAGAELNQPQLRDVDEVTRTDKLLRIKAFQRIVSPMRTEAREASLPFTGLDAA